MQELPAIAQEGTRQLDDLGSLVRRFDEPILREDEDLRIRVAEDDRRMRRDDELRTLRDEVVDPAHQCEIPAEGQSGFGLVEDEQAIWPETVGHKGNERLTVRFLMKRAAVRVGDRRVAQLLDIGSHVKEAFGPEEEASARPAGATYETHVLVQH